jgi:DNA helicase HerA-like ATPase
MQTEPDGRGVINILAADKLMQAPKVYAAFLLWLLSELFEHLPEVGDRDKPKLVFFFDEAHLLFDDAPEILLDKIEQVVRLIRSKGVGVYFVTQNPLDVPDKVLGQLGNRIQHALRAFTPRDQKAVRSAAETMRDNPELDEKTAITELGVGEALVSLLDEKGRPHIVERAFILPPQSKIGPVDAAQRKRLIGESPIAGYYEKTVDRESAYEMLKVRAAEDLQRRAGEAGRPDSRPAAKGIFDTLGSILGTPSRGKGKQRESAMEAFAKSAARSIGRELGRELLRGVLGSLSGRRR